MNKNLQLNINIGTNKKYKLIFFLLLFIFFTPIFLAAQPSLLDTKGKDFWLTFIPNFHGNGATEDSLYIYVSSAVPTSGQINYKDYNGFQYTQKFDITDPSKIYVFRLMFYDFELRGYNPGGGFWSRNQSEKIAPQTFHVTSDSDVTVYALSEAVFTADAFIVLPSRVLGFEYLILSYNSDGRTNTNSRTPSQFSIVAIEDSTEVLIKPTAATYVNGITPFTLKLSKGDAFLVQAAFDKGEVNPDLTGTDVTSNKPIAIFSGHQRATLPYDLTGPSLSRDCLIEQLQPFDTWGKDAFIVPVAQPPGVMKKGNDLFRILAAYDSTNISINGTFIVTLDKGGFYEGNAERCSVINADRPISIALYKKTSGDGSSGSTFNLGDPFMMIIPPREQFLNNYRFISVQAWGTDNIGNYGTIYKNQYVTLIAQDTTIKSIILDGSPVDPNKFIKIPFSNGYSYANLAVGDNVHDLSSNGNVGLFIYGYGEAVSYGYVGGMNFKPINFKPPTINSVDSCYLKYGYSYPANVAELPVFSLIPDSVDNVILSISPYDLSTRGHTYNAKLIDNRKDGSFTLTAIDSFGVKTKKSFDIPGYTVALNNNILVDTIPVVNVNIRKKFHYCFPLNLTNYGKFIHEVNSLKFSNPAVFSLTINPPFEISPKSNIGFNVCFYSDIDTVYTDTLQITGECGERSLLALNFNVITKPSKPDISKISDSCNSKFNLTITDSTMFDYGIKDLTIVTSQNCDIVTKLFTAPLIKLDVNIQDARKDAIYKLIAIDSIGNSNDIIDTIQGFTIAFDSFGDISRTINLGNVTIGSMQCDSVDILNYGILPFTFSDIHFIRNIAFSIPQSQLPFSILPGEKKSFKICFRPDTVSIKPYKDSLYLGFNCVSNKLSVSGLGDVLIHEGTSQCDVPIKLTTNAIPKFFFIDGIYPNPVNSTGKIIIGTPDENRLILKIFNISGKEMQNQASLNLHPGIYEAYINVDNFPEGYYTLVVHSSTQIFVKQFFILK